MAFPLALALAAPFITLFGDFMTKAILGAIADSTPRGNTNPNLFAYQKPFSDFMELPWNFPGWKECCDKSIPFGTALDGRKVVR